MPQTSDQYWSTCLFFLVKLLMLLRYLTAHCLDWAYSAKLNSWSNQISSGKWHCKKEQSYVVALFSLDAIFCSCSHFLSISSDQFWKNNKITRANHPKGKPAPNESDGLPKAFSQKWHFFLFFYFSLKRLLSWSMVTWKPHTPIHARPRARPHAHTRAHTHRKILKAAKVHNDIPLWPWC